MIGIFSDYPARAKIEAMGLVADHIVSANDEGIGVLKPQTRGLVSLLKAAGKTANQTLLIGDRVERDGLAARQLGVRSLIRSGKPIAGWQTFRRYDEALFAPMVER